MQPADKVGSIPDNLESHYRMHCPVFLVHEGLDIRESLHCALYCQFCGAIIVTVYFIVILCFRMDKNTYDNTEVFNLVFWYYAFLNRICYGSCHSCLCRSEYLGCLSHVLDRNLWHNKCCRFCKKVWPYY